MKDQGNLFNQRLHLLVLIRINEEFAFEGTVIKLKPCRINSSGNLTIKPTKIVIYWYIDYMVR